MSLYACSRCGTVNVGTPGECPSCGHDEYEAVDDSKYVCETCGESFDSQQGLNSHQRVHQDDEPEDDEPEDDEGEQTELDPGDDEE